MSSQTCTHLYCDASQGRPRLAVFQVVWPDQPWLTDAFVCEQHAEDVEFNHPVHLVPLADAPPAYGPPAVRSDKVAGLYLVESIAVGDLVKGDRRLFPSRVESITDLGGSIVLHLADGSTLEQRWGHVVEVVAAADAPWLAESLDRLVAAATAPVRPWTPPVWDCRTPSGHHFTMSFTDGAQRDAVEAHWLDRHDYCKACPECDGCSHPDCETCNCADAPDDDHDGWPLGPLD